METFHETDPPPINRSEFNPQVMGYDQMALSPTALSTYGLQSMFDTIDYLIVQDGYQCAACTSDKRRTYRDMPQLRRHMVKHVNGGRTSGTKTEIRCNHCNSTFDRVDSLRKHLLEALNKQYGAAVVEVNEEERDSCEVPVNYIVKNGCLSCSVCDAEFGAVTRWNKEKFKMHVGKEHWKLPAYRCHECGRRFAELANFEKHMKRHSDMMDVSWMGTEPSTSVDIKADIDSESGDEQDSKLFSIALADPVHVQLEEMPLPEVQIKVEPDDDMDQSELCGSVGSPASSRSSVSPFNSDSESESTEKKGKKRKTQGRQIPGAEDNSIILACNLCDEGFLLQELLDRHMQQKHDDRDRPFSCTQCSKTYMTNGNLQEHIRMVHSGVKFPCRVCGIKLSTKSSWKRHMKGHTDEGFSCDICREKFSSHSVLAKHKRRVHEKAAKNYICVDCGNTYDSNAALREHRISHTDERKWECGVCGLKFKRNHNLINHKKTHSIEKPVTNFECQECDEEFVTKSALATHRSQVHGKICCRLCKRTFENQSDLMQHRRDDHQISHKERGVSCRTCHKRCIDHEELQRHRAEVHLMEEPLECNICKASFATPVGLRAHQREHQRVLLYNCPNCSETYNSQLLLETHMKEVHADMKNHVCDLCGSGYPTRKQLVSHLGRHRNPRKKNKSNMPGHYICDVCGKEFNFKVTLKRHVFNFHVSQRKFQCEVCQKMMTSAEGLKLHMRGHSDQLVMCELCGKGFSQPYRLREHMVRHAREDVAERCTVCHRTFRDMKKLDLHMKSHTGETEFCCAPCQRYFASNRLYRLHIKRMHESETMCPRCDKVFPTEKKMKNHIRIHDNPHMFECPTCYSCIKDKKHFDRHLRLHKYEGVRLPCRFCPQTFSMPKTRRHHETRFHSDQQAHNGNAEGAASGSSMQDPEYSATMARDDEVSVG